MCNNCFRICFPRAVIVPGTFDFFSHPCQEICFYYWWMIYHNFENCRLSFVVATICRHRSDMIEIYYDRFLSKVLWPIQFIWVGDEKISSISRFVNCPESYYSMGNCLMKLIFQVSISYDDVVLLDDTLIVLSALIKLFYGQ